MSDAARHDGTAVELERYELRAKPRYRFALQRRDFLKTLGGGLLVCVVAARLDAQETGRRRGRNRPRAPEELNAWLHIDAQGRVRVFCGKTEVGQNIRTSLTQVVADELNTPLETIELVMADTQLTPPDAGTFGSRTTPDMSPRLRRAAAAMRAMLIELAAAKSQRGGGEFSASDGKIVHRDGGISFLFAELASGQQFAKSIADAPVRDATDWRVAGQPTAKVNGRDFVTGKHQYASDMQLPGMLHGKVLRGPAVQSKLVSYDADAARGRPGVIVVQDGDFVGVVAPTEHEAQQAIDAMRTEWNNDGGASDSELFDRLRSTAEGPGQADQQDEVAQAIEAAAHSLRATYTIAYIAHAPLEPRAAVAQWTDGRLTVWTGTQRPFGVQGDLAEAFGISSGDVRVIVPDTGSAYGGKHTNDAAIEAARLARACGQPVKLVWTREEEFTWAYFRPAGVIDIAAGASADGKLTAWEHHNYNSGGSSIRPLYDIAVVRAEAHGASSPLKQGSYRALAATANHFARECHIDDMAKLVDVDPLEFRLRNLTDERLRAVLNAAAERLGWKPGASDARRGFGIAGGSEKGSYVATCAEVAVEPNGGQVRVVRLVTAFECGAIVNPTHLENQVEGAVVMGLGGALFEAIHFTEGRIENASFGAYRVPRFRDVPALETVLVNRPDLPSVGAGETPIVAVAPAIGNAIFAATGRRLRSLPMLPE